ncbi:MAG: hypothetical protein NVSMB5_25390 [Candidatus Velthaea sp.]
MRTPCREAVDIVPNHRPHRNAGFICIVHWYMLSPFRLTVAAALVLALGLPALAQPKKCAGETLTVEDTPVCVAFTAEAPSATSVVVHETFSAGGKSTSSTFTFDILPGAASSRTIHNADISPLVAGRTLHMSLRYGGGAVTLEHAQLLPGGKPLK